MASDWKKIVITTKDLPNDITGVEGSSVGIIGEITLPIARFNRPTKLVTLFITSVKMGSTKIIFGVPTMKTLGIALLDTITDTKIMLNHDPDARKQHCRPKKENAAKAMEEKI